MIKSIDTEEAPGKIIHLQGKNLQQTERGFPQLDF